MLRFSSTFTFSESVEIINKHCAQILPNLNFAILGKYCEPGRHYQNVYHVASMLENAALLNAPKHLLTAILFHDVILKSNDPEIDSAEFALEYLQTAFDTSFLKKVTQLVQVTNYTTYPLGFNNDVLDRDIALIRMLDVVELFHLETALINDRKIYLEATEYFKIDFNTYVNKRRAFIDSIKNIHLPFTEEFLALAPEPFSEPKIIAENLLFNLNHLPILAEKAPSL